MRRLDAFRRWFVKVRIIIINGSNCHDPSSNMRFKSQIVLPNNMGFEHTSHDKISGKESTENNHTQHRSQLERTTPKRWLAPEVRLARVRFCERTAELGFGLLLPIFFSNFYSFHPQSNISSTITKIKRVISRCVSLSPFPQTKLFYDDGDWFHWQEVLFGGDKYIIGELSGLSMN